MRNNKVILFTGISGAIEKEFLEQVENLMPRDKKVEIIDFRHDYLYDEIELNPFLERSNKDRKEKWLKCFNYFFEKFLSLRESHDFIFLIMNTIWVNRIHPKNLYVDFFSPISWNGIRAINPAIIINIIDDIYTIYKKVKETEREKQTSDKFLTHFDLLQWRQQEINMSSILAKQLYFDLDDLAPSIYRTCKLGPLPESKSKKNPYYNFLYRGYRDSIEFFVVSRNQSPSFLKDLILSGKDLTKVYTSFPISNTRDEHRKEIDDFLNQLKQKPEFIVFDPLAIDELPFTDYLEGKDKPPWPERPNCNYKEVFQEQKEYFEKDVRKIRNLSDDSIRYIVDELKQAIMWQIRLRDFQLIEQTDCLAVFDPFYPSGEASQGVSVEIKKGSDEGKEVIILDKGFCTKEFRKEDEKNGKSPFSFKCAHKIADNIEELISWLQKIKKPEKYKE